jgi:hypothetical protein
VEKRPWWQAASEVGALMMLSDQRQNRGIPFRLFVRPEDRFDSQLDLGLVDDADVEAKELGEAFVSHPVSG